MRTIPRAFAAPAVRERLAVQRFVIRTATPAASGELIKRHLAPCSKFVKEAGIKGD